MPKSKRTKACDITKKVREAVKERDGSKCIWCGRYLAVPQLCHYIGRGAGGLGIPENLVCGCPNCHREADQGTNTKAYKLAMRDYLQRQYDDWDDSILRFRKDG